MSASLFVGFPNADIEFASLSAVVVTDGDPGLARRWCDELLDMAWEQRARFVYKVEALADSLSQAQALAGTRGASSGQIVLLDHSDNCASGGTMDSMTVLAAILDAGLQDVAAFAVFDPEAVQQMVAAGVGAQVTRNSGDRCIRWTRFDDRRISCRRSAQPCRRRKCGLPGRNRNEHHHLILF